MRMKTGLLFAILLFAAVFARPTLIILDASGSMSDTMDDGMTKIDAAKIAAKELVSVANDQIALMVYTDCDSGGNPQSGAISLRVDFTTDKQLLNQNIDSISPDSMTPIADAIREGSTYVGSKGNNAGIVLLTDGEETCGFLDADEVEELAGENGVSIINIVGFQLDPYYQSEIRKVAEVTGGSYYDAEDLETLKTSMKEAYTSASSDERAGIEALSAICCPSTASFILLAAGMFALYSRKD